MADKSNFLSSVAPWDTVAEGYSETTMKLFQCYSDKAISLTKINDESKIVDIACGPGTLALRAAETVRSVYATDFSSNMINILNRKVTHYNIKNITTHCANGQQLPYANKSFDAAYSMFGLMFFPDRDKGYSEIMRTLKPAGEVVISSWAPVVQSPAMQAMFGALQVINPEIPDPQTDIESLENPDFFEQELVNAGFRNVAIHTIHENYPIHSIEKFWEDMVKGSAPIIMLKNSLPESLWQEKSALAQEYLKRILGDETTSLSATAYLGYGIK